MEGETIHVLYIWTGDMGKMDVGYMHSPCFMTIDGSRVLVHQSEEIKGWDFGAPNSSSTKHYRKLPNGPCLYFVGGIRRYRTFLPGIEDTVTGKEVF